MSRTNNSLSTFLKIIIGIVLLIGLVHSAKKSTYTICHKPGTPAQRTLVVPASSLAAHISHGDTFAACPIVTPPSGECTCNITAIAELLANDPAFINATKGDKGDTGNDGNDGGKGDTGNCTCDATDIIENVHVTCQSEDDAQLPYLFKDNLVAFWNFNESSGTVAADTSGFSPEPFNLEVLRTPGNIICAGPLTPEEYGYTEDHWENDCGFHVTNNICNKAKYLANATGTDSSSIGAAIGNSEEYTIEFWLDVPRYEPDTFLSYTDRKLLLIDSPQGPSPLLIRRSEANTNVMEIKVFEAGTISIEAFYNGFHDVQIVLTVVNNGNVVIYANGELIETTPTDAGSTSAMAGFGSIQLFDETVKPEYNAVVHKLAMWDRALSPSEVLDTFNAGKCFPKSCAALNLSLNAN